MWSHIFAIFFNADSAKKKYSPKMSHLEHHVFQYTVASLGMLSYHGAI